MGMTVLSRLAAGAAVPVFPVIGAGALADVERLLVRPTLHRAETPRDAAILLVAGDLPQDTTDALDRVHDQLPRPRATLTWDGADDPGPALGDLWRAILSGEADEEDRNPDEPPNPWRGRGDHGQGGEGMMGGTPYGRPMAMTGEDVRDGLQLDRYTARVGPFAPMLPPGLVLEFTLQGDVIVGVEVQAPPFPQSEAADAPDLCAARMLRLLGLGAAATRLLRGKAPRAAWMRGAMPSGLAVVDGAQDARGRLLRWLSGESFSVDADGIFERLVGLEWAEATIALASFPPSAIRSAAEAA